MKPSALPIALCLQILAFGAPNEIPNGRPPKSAADFQYWLRTMTADHRYNREEIEGALGLGPEEVERGLAKWKRELNEPILPEWNHNLAVRPYPGGRHPRIGFLDGAVNPQRETKVSVFTPWDRGSYVVADVPEAIWSNLGLTYLAHSHVPTIWSKNGVELERQEWKRLDHGVLEMERRLPNGIAFGTKVVPHPDSVRMTMWLTNGTTAKLTDLRVQNCVMLKGASGFTSQTNANKVFSKPYVAARSEDGKRWVITAWVPCDRAWANAPVPCLHSDPKFPDCEPGETKTLRGWLSFYEGTDIQSEFKRIDGLNWQTEK